MVLTFLLLLLDKSPEDIARDAQKALVGDHRQAYVLALLGLAGTLTPVVLSWFKDRSNVSRASQQLDEGVKRISFWEQWLKLSASLGEDAAAQARQRVQHELELLSEAFGNAAAALHSEASALKQRKEQFTSKLSSISTFRRVFLLYKPSRPMAWIPRFFFYLFTFFAILSLVLVIGFARDVDTLIGALFFLSFNAVVGVGFRALSVFTERPHKSTDDHAVSLPPTPLPSDPAI